MNRDRELELLANAALAAAAYAPSAPDWPVCGFLASVGWNYDRTLMVLGRAPNGWASGWSPDALTSVEAAERFASETLDGVQRPTGSSGPMNWVAEQWGASEGYSTARSAFWRVIREVYAGISEHAKEPSDWSDHLAWSNLYKLAPEDGGNPSETLSSLQFATCLRMFRTELDEFAPRHVVILSGWGWARPFIEPTCDWSPGEGHVEAAARYSHDDDSVSKVVVAPHPQGRSESPLAQAVIAAFANA